MANIIDYIDWRGDLSFNQASINKVDIVALSQLALIAFDDILINRRKELSMTIEEAYHVMVKHGVSKYENMGLIIPKAIIPMFEKMASAKRYRNLIIGNYQNIVSVDKETQFCGLTIDLNESTRCVIFSGTDDTIIGWKENFNMLRVDQTPAQKTSCSYLERCGVGKEKLYVLGHSKGGNLALFSTINVNRETFDKIIHCYNIDGPGLTEDINKISDFDERIKKLTLIIPQTSVVGRLFEHYEHNYVVHSNVQGLYQHDAFSWEVMGAHFIKEEALTDDASHIEKKIKDITNTLDGKMRDDFVESLYKMLTIKDSKTLTEVSKSGFQVVKAYVGLEGDVKKLFTKIINDLLKDKVIIKNLVSNIRDFSKFNNSQKVIVKKPIKKE